MTEKTIKAVVFDMDGVLCHYDLDRRLAILSYWSGRTSEEIHAAVFASGFEELAERGQLSAQDYLDGFSERIGYRLTRAQWAQARREAIEPHWLPFAAVESLSGRYVTAMLTNNGYLLKELLGEVFPQASTAFGQRAFFSAELGARKPEPEVYRRLCSQIGLEPTEVAYLDDDPEYVRSASSTGLQAAHVEDPGRISSVIAQLGLEV